MDWTFIRYISGPVIGAVIGCFTNYIAVKMLFYPRHEIRVLGHRLPFTPGAIPKGKDRLARAAGSVVAGSLLTKEDLEGLLLSEQVENGIAASVMPQMHTSLREILLHVTGVPTERYERKKSQLCAALSEEVVQAVDVQALVQEHGGEMLRKKAEQNGVMKLVLSEKRRQSITDQIADELQAKIDEHGAEYVQGILAEKLDSLEQETALALLGQFGATEEKLRTAVIDTYRRLVGENMDRMLGQIDIGAIVTDKINAMSVEEMERLVLQMMKKELSTIVSLGALIGFVLGLLNLFLN